MVDVTDKELELMETIEKSEKILAEIRAKQEEPELEPELEPAPEPEPEIEPGELPEPDEWTPANTDGTFYDADKHTVKPGTLGALWDRIAFGFSRKKGWAWIYIIGSGRQVTRVILPKFQKITHFRKYGKTYCIDRNRIYYKKSVPILYYHHDKPHPIALAGEKSDITTEMLDDIVSKSMLAGVEIQKRRDAWMSFLPLITVCAAVVAALLCFSMQQQVGGMQETLVTLTKRIAELKALV